MTDLPESLVMPQGWSIKSPGTYPTYQRVDAPGPNLLVWFNGFLTGWHCLDIGRSKGTRVKPYLPDGYPSAIGCMMAAEFKLAAEG